MANLTKEDIARIMSGQAVGPNEYYDPQSGRTYTFRNGDGRYEGDTYIQGDPQEILATDWAPGRFKDNAEMNGQSMDRYGMGGDYLGSETITGLKDRNQFVEIAKILAAPVAMYGAQAMGLVGGANPVLGAEGMGSAAGGSGFSLAGSDAAFSNALAGGMGTDGIALAAGDGAFNSALGSSGLLDAGMVAPAAGGSAFEAALKGAGAAAKNPLLGGLVTGLGALAGSQGAQDEATSTRKTDPRVDPYLFGNEQMPGLLNAAQARLMADQGQQGIWESMKSKGMGLLNSPVAPNGFAAFTKGRY
jgi:hypothetical protein